MTYKGLILKSRTLDLNAVAGLMLLAEQNLSFLEGMIPANVYPYLAFGLIMANGAMRFVTKGPVGNK